MLGFVSYLQPSQAANRTMTHQAIRTDQAPAAIGPYSQAIVVDGWLFTSGQIALDPATGEMVGAGDVVAEAKQVARNLLGVLAAAGCSPADVVKCTVFLADMADFARVNDVYATLFDGAEPPARSCVAAAGLPKGARVEIEAIAKLPG